MLNLHGDTVNMIIILSVGCLDLTIDTNSIGNGYLYDILLDNTQE